MKNAPFVAATICLLISSVPVLGTIMRETGVAEDARQFGDSLMAAELELLFLRASLTEPNVVVKLVTLTHDSTTLTGEQVISTLARLPKPVACTATPSKAVLTVDCRSMNKDEVAIHGSSMRGFDDEFPSDPHVPDPERTFLIFRRGSV